MGSAMEMRAMISVATMAAPTVRKGTAEAKPLSFAGHGLLKSNPIIPVFRHHQSELISAFGYRCLSREEKWNAAPKRAHGAITLVVEQSYSPGGAVLKHLEAATAIRSAYGPIGTGQRICPKYRPAPCPLQTFV